MDQDINNNNNNENYNDKNNININNNNFHNNNINNNNNDNLNKNKDIMVSNKSNIIESINTNNLITKKKDKRKKRFIILSIVLFSIVIILLLIIGIYYSKSKISQNTILKKHGFFNNKIEFQSFSQPELYFKSNFTSIEYDIYNNNQLDNNSSSSNNNNNNNSSITKSPLKLIDTKIINNEYKNINPLNQLFSIQLSTMSKNKVYIQSFESLFYWKMNTDINRIELVHSSESGDCFYFSLIETTVLGCSNCFKILNCDNKYLKFTNNQFNSPINSTSNNDDPFTIIKINIFKN